MSNKKIFLLVLPFFAFSLSFGQNWPNNPDPEMPNLDSLRRQIENYFRENPDAKGKKQSGRGLYFAESRTLPNGDFPDPGILWDQWQQYGAQRFPQGRMFAPAANWTEWGPTPFFNTRVGRVQCIRLEPGNPRTIWIGTPAGGIWKSTDAGASWTSLTDQLPILGASDIAIHPTRPDTVYAATGDADAGTLNNIYSLGVIKTTDGGLNWISTGLNWTNTMTRRISRLLIDPSNPDVLIAATSNGIYRSSDAGSNWIQTRAGNHRDVEFMPGSSSIVHAASATNIYRSTDNGQTWSLISAGLPASGVSRIAIAVSPANPSVVWAIYANTSYGFLGLYKSTDAGLTYANVPTTVGGLVGPFTYFAFTLAVSPVNANVICVGGVQAKQSSDGGITSGSVGTQNDYHAMEFLPGTSDTMFIGNDKGIFRVNNVISGGWSATSLNNGLRIMQIYKMGLAAGNPKIAFMGTQDIGTFKLNMNNTNLQDVVFNADGGECAVDYTDTNYVWVEKEYGQMFRSVTGGDAFSFSAVSPPGQANNGYFVTPFGLHTQNPQIIYAGYAQVWKSTDRGTNWTNTNSPGTTALRSLAVAPTDGDFVYAATGTAVYKTLNGGFSWFGITAGLPAGTITNIGVHQSNPNTVFVTFGGFTTGQKIYKSTNAGGTWTNISTGLPNVPANCIVHENRSNGLYVGTDLGVWYTNDTLGGWISYNDGLPVVIINELEIQTGPGRIVAGSMGRGLWISDLYNFQRPPAANFIATPAAICAGDSVSFADLSSENPLSWQWSFSGGNPATSSSPNPTVVYPVAGIYSVSLIAGNAAGTDTLTRMAYITVHAPPPVPLISRTGNTLYSSAPNGNQWFFQGNPVPGAVSATFVPAQSGLYSLTVTDLNGCSSSSPAYNFNFMPEAAFLAQPLVLCEGDSVIFTDQSAYSPTSWAWDFQGGVPANSVLHHPAVHYPNPGVFDVTLVAGNASGNDTLIQAGLITVFQNPPPPLISQSGNSLLSSFPSGNQWFLGGNPIPGADSSVFFPSQNGSYTVLYTDPNGCVSVSAPFNFVFTDLTGSALPQVRIYPNPARDRVMVSMTLPSEGSFRILDMPGREIWRKDMTGQSEIMEIDCQGFSPGLYILEIRMPETLLREKLIIERE